MILSKAVEWLSILGIFIGLAKWIFQLKADVNDAHKRIEILESRHNRVEDKIDSNMQEINRRIDDCKNVILASVNNLMQVLNKN